MEKEKLNRCDQHDDPIWFVADECPACKNEKLDPLWSWYEDVWHNGDIGGLSMRGLWLVQSIRPIPKFCRPRRVDRLAGIGVIAQPSCPSR